MTTYDDSAWMTSLQGLRVEHLGGDAVLGGLQRSAKRREAELVYFDPV